MTDHDLQLVRRCEASRGARPLASGMVLLGLAFLLSGCSVMPLYPSLGEVTRDDTCYNVAVSTNDLTKQKECLTALRATLSNGQRATSLYQRNIEYLGLAGGTFAGYRILKAGDAAASDGPLESSALGLAALAGLSSQLNTKETHRVLSAGVTAIDCLFAAADAVEATNSNASAAFGASYAGNAGSFFASSSAAAVAAKYRENETAGAYLGIVSTRLNTQLRAIADAKNALPARLAHGYRTLFGAIHSALTKREGDVTEIFKNQMTQVTRIVGEILETNERTEDVKLHAAIAGRTLGLEELPIPHINTEQAEDVKDACIAPVLGS